MSRNPVGLTTPSSEYDEKFIVASINAFINNLELIDKVIRNNFRMPIRTNTVSDGQKARGKQRIIE